MNLILFGLKGCGKTTCGGEVAKKLNRTFIDTDNLIENRHFAEAGEEKHFREIFKELGPQRFRQMEEKAVESLESTENAVISVGGGTMRNGKNNVKILGKIGRLIYMFVDKETLKDRLFSLPELPAFLDAKNPDESFDKMFEERNQEYLLIPDILKLDISQLSISESVELIVAMMNDKKFGN